LTLADVREFRIEGAAIPTLEDVIATVGGRLRIYCELKGGGTVGLAVAALAPLGDRAAVHSFDHRMVAEAARIAPALARGVLETSYHRDPCFPMRDVGARDLWQHDALVDAALVAGVHAEGGRVIAWTVNDPERARALAAMGVDGLCTDDVATMRRVTGA
jgi:glycerophosphoryl diester phosphodiesterase